MYATSALTSSALSSLPNAGIFLGTPLVTVAVMPWSVSEILCRLGPITPWPLSPWQPVQSLAKTVRPRAASDAEEVACERGAGCAAACGPDGGAGFAADRVGSA